MAKTPDTQLPQGFLMFMLMEKGGLSAQERAMVMTMIDTTKTTTLYEQARHNMMKIMTGNKQEEKLQFKSNDTFYIPSGGPNRFPQRAAAGGWKP